MKRFIFIVLLLFITILLSACNISNSSGLASSSKENALFLEPKPPEGGLLVGEYYSPENNYKFKVWSFKKASGEVSADFVFYDIDKGYTKKVPVLNLVQNDKENVLKQSVIWIDSKKALINGHILFETEGNKLSELNSDKAAQILDYHVNNSKSALAYLSFNDQSVDLVMIDLDTLYELPIYSYHMENSLLKKDDLKVFWGNDNNIYFNVNHYGKPTVYYYDTLKNECEIILYNTVLHSLNQKTGEFKLSLFNSEGKPTQQKTLTLDEINTYSEPRKIIKVATKYIEDAGEQVGNEYGKVVLSLEHMFENKATVLFGPWASEFIGEIILEKTNGVWKVVYKDRKWVENRYN